MPSLAGCLLDSAAAAAAGMLPWPMLLLLLMMMMSMFKEKKEFCAGKAKVEHVKFGFDSYSFSGVKGGEAADGWGCIKTSRSSIRR